MKRYLTLVCSGLLTYESEERTVTLHPLVFKEIAVPLTCRCIQREPGWEAWPVMPGTLRTLYRYRVGGTQVTAG